MLYDIDHEKAEKEAIKWNAWHVYNLNIAFQDSKLKPDIVVIATPDNTHYHILKEVAKYKPKLVICEKPICTNLEQAKEIVELYRRKNIPLMVNYTRRFLPYYQELKRRYQNKEFGKFLDFNIKFNRGLLHTGSHAIDFITWFFDIYNVVPNIDEIKTTDYRIWQIQLFFEKYFWQEQRIGNMPIWDYYDKSHYYVVKNAFNFLESKEELKCTGEDALKTLEICFELMEEK